MNATERAVRAAVDRTHAEARIKTAEFRVDKAVRALQAWEKQGHRFKQDVKDAQAALAALKNPKPVEAV